MVGYDWCISILTFPARSCSLNDPFLYHSHVAFLDRGYPRFGNFNSAVPVDVIRVKSYVDSYGQSDYIVRQTIIHLLLLYLSR